MNNSRKTEALQIAQQISDRLYSDRNELQKFLHFSSNIYKLSASGAMQIFAQKDDATMISTYDGWRAIGRQVEAGQRSKTVIDASGKIIYYFDISQTIGDRTPALWRFNRDVSDALVQGINSELPDTVKNLSDCIDKLTFKYVQEREGDAAAALGITPENRDAFRKSLLSMAKSIVVSRCTTESEYKYRGNKEIEADLSAVDMCKTKSDFLKLMSYVQMSAKSVLLTFERKMNEIQNQRSDRNERDRNQNRERNDNVLLRNSEQVLSRNADGREARNNVQTGYGDMDLQSRSPRDGEQGVHRADEGTDRNLRAAVAGVYAGTAPGEDTGASAQSSLDDNSSSDRERSAGKADSTGGRVSEKISGSDELLGESKVLQDNADGELVRDNAGDRPASKRITDDTGASQGVPVTVRLEIGSTDVDFDYRSMAIREWEDDNSPEIKEFPNEEEMNHYISLIYGDDTLQLLNKHRSNVSYLYNLDIVPVLAKSTLAWDEIESLGYRFFDEEYIDKHQPSDKAVYGNGLTETKLYELIRRMRSGEDISKDFTLELYGRGERAYIHRDDNTDIAINQRTKGTVLHLSYGYFEGYSKDVPYKELFESYLNYFRKEYEEIQISVFKEETKERFHNIDGNSADDVERTVKEYAESVLKENNIEANIVNIALTGSRSRGIENESSDIDVVIEVNSELKEDALFNILHGQPFSIGGISVDINPIRAEETGTLGSYLPKAEKYLAEKEKSATYSTIEQEQSPAFFRIYQLKEGDKYHYNRFESFESNKDDHLTIDDYDLVYEGKWDDLKGTSAEERLAEIWNNLNGFQLPDNYNGHSLSMSDVIVVGNDTNQTAYYVDRFGFPEMPEFLLEKEQVIKEDAMDKAMRLINEYCDKEFGEPANFSNMDRVGLAYTTDEQTELEIEVYADLESFRIVKEYDGKVVHEELFNDLEDMNAALGNLEFDDLVSLDDNEKDLIRATYSTNTSDPVNENITITCEWSESNAFEDGKTYSVYEFDRIMSEADNERVAGEARAVEKYGSRGAWYESDVQDEFSRFKGYDKVKFTVNFPNGTSITERQDIGDGYGGVINYFRQIQQNNTADRLEQQRQIDIQALGVANNERIKDEEDDFSDIDTEKIRKALEETPPDQSPFIQQVMRDVEEIERAAAKEKNPSSNYEQQNFESLAAAEESKSTDYHIPESFAYETGMKARFENNYAAIQTLKKIEGESRSATPEEQEVLSKYAGWGGIRLAFEENNSSWSDEYKRLKDLLTPEEYEAARSSVLTSFYTPPVVIDTMYKALENFGFKGGKIIDPSMGTGNFYGKMPDSIRDKSRLTGVELDSISGRIAKQLYPNADISITGFEQKKIENDTFDVAIGNIPFDNYSLHDPEYNKYNFLIHDYFFAKSLDKVAEGGIVAFVTSKGTLDKKSPAFREYLAGKADLIGAIRLPNSAFNEVGTEVTSDIIFLQKNSHKTLVEKPDWVYTAENAEGITINQYFVDHPEMILGKMEMKSGRFGPEETCSPLPGADLKEQLEKAVSNLKAQFAVQRRTEKQNADNGVIPAPSEVRNFTFTSINDEIFYRENDNLRRIELTPQQTERVQGLINVRETLRDLITAQTNGCSDAELEARQRELNTVYDRFLRKYGTISDKSNSKVFAEDDYYNLLKSLENINPETKEVTKAEIFSKRTIKPEIEVSRADSPEEALQISLDLKGRVDIEYMSNLTGMSKADVTSQLEQAELIYLDPMKAEIGNMDNAYEDAAEYLSGNIRDKLNEAEFAKAKFIDNPEILQKINKNIEALNGVLPERIEAGDIKAEIGVNWVDVRDYEQFIAEHSKLMSDLISRYAPLRRTINGEYKMQNKNSFNGNVGVTSVAGTSRINSLKIFENLLNKRDVVVKDLKMINGEERYIINQKETELAQEKARQMKDAFQKWIFATPERREKYVERYNVLFNSIRGREYDGSKQSFPGMSPDIELKPHQKDAVMRAKLGGNTLLAHVVGAGKSFEMVAATMEKKRLGLINKACMVVPKHLVGQTALEWQRLYPNAHILTATEKDFTKDNRNKFIGRCVTGNYDAVIMSYEQFEKIPMSLEYRMSFLQREVDEIVAGINEAKSNRDNMTVKDLERQRKQIQKKIQKLMEGGKTKDTALNFEQLGFDYLVVDEAHNYKNGLVVTKMHNVSGVQCSPAQKSEDILMKTQYINEMTGYKGLLFATGTPIITP